MANTSEYRNVISNIDSALAENSTEAISTEAINTDAISEGIANLLTDTNTLKKSMNAVMSCSWEKALCSIVQCMALNYKAS